MKNKVLILFALAAVCATLFVGCKKEEGPLVSFGTEIAQIGDNSKIYMSGSNSNVPKYFTSGESVYINESVKEITSTYKIQGVTASTTGYYAVYPSSIVVASGTRSWINQNKAYSISVKLPCLQTYDFAEVGEEIVQKVNLPVGAVIPASSTSKMLRFHSLCSLVEVQWTNPSSTESHTITSIEVTAAGKGLWVNGTAIINGASSTINVPYDTVNSTVVLEIPNAHEGVTYRETIEPGHTSRKYYVVVPPYNESTEFMVKINFDGGLKTIKLKRTGTVPENTIIRIARNEEPTTNKEISGYFSIGTNKKVVFSKGNLQHIGHPTNVDPDTWHFATNQYDYFGANNLKGSSGEDAQVLSNNVDLFCWSIDNEDQGTNMPAHTYGLRAVDEDDDYVYSAISSDNFADWGELVIDGDPANTWFTLSNDEWDFLLNKRRNATQLRVNVNITGIQNHPAGASVTNVHGCLLFPDDWTNERLPANIELSTNGVTTLSYENFRRLEAAGCVLLPEAGYREVDDDWQAITISYSNGFYWTNTFSGTSTSVHGDHSEAYFMMYSYTTQRYASAELNADAQIIYGCSVRLVKPAPGYTYSSMGRLGPTTTPTTK